MFSKIENCSEEILKVKNKIQILSVGQIRPEKNHKLQLELFSEVLRIVKEENLNYEVNFFIKLLF